MWTTFNENGDVRSIPDGNFNEISYERMKALEENTNFEFKNEDKAKALINDVSKEAVKTGVSIDNFVGEVGGSLLKGIKNGANLFKYLPYLLVAGLIYKFFIKGSKRVSYAT